MPSAKPDDLVQKTLWKALLPPLLAVGILLYLLVNQLHQMRTAADEVRRTDQVLAQADRTLRLLIDMDAGQRGFLIGGQEKFLETYQAGRGQLGKEFTSLDRLVRTEEAHRSLLSLQELNRNWQRSADREIALRRRGGAQAARDFNTGRSDDLMDTIRARFDALIDQQEDLREERTRQVEAVSRWLFTVGAGAAVAIGALLAASTVYQLRSLSRQYRTLVHDEQQARESMTTTLQSIGDAVLVTDTKGRITLMNPVATRLTGWPQPDVQGKDHEIVFAIRDESTGSNRTSPVRAVLQDGQSLPAISQGVLLRRDGQPVPIEDSAAPIRNSAGDLQGVVLVFRDVTERRAKEAALAALGEKDRRIAETLQRSMLLAPTKNQFPGIAVSTQYESAWEEAQVGGDFHDTFQISDTRTALVVGDVTGKGLEAAVYTAEIKFVLRAYLRETPDPALALARLNRFLIEAERLGDRPGQQGAEALPEIGSSKMAAVAVIVLDAATGETLCATGGAEPPLVFCAETGQARELPTGGGIVGMNRDAHYQNEPLSLAPGDFLVVTTDGITEARNPARQFFGPEGIVETVRQYAQENGGMGSVSRDVDALGKHLTERTKAFAAGKLHDDVCVLVAARIG